MPKLVTSLELMKSPNIVLKKSFVIFWFIWWLTAFWTDLIGGLSHLKLINAAWAPDTNYPFLVKSLAMYPVHTSIPAIFFIGILLWTALNTILFARAMFKLASPQDQWLPRVERAYLVSLLFWLAFFVADQMIMNFTLEENHMVQGGFQLLSFFVFYLLPDRY